ncbi:MAG: hypothetical protein ACYDCL_02990 [Myxococcales bacterium]
MKEQTQNEVVRFSTTGAAIAGALAGVAIAIGFPWVVLVHGEVLGSHMQLVLVWVGIILGGTISFTSAFFGLVMPSQVGHGDLGHLVDQWERFERIKKGRAGEPTSDAPASK